MFNKKYEQILRRQKYCIIINNLENILVFWFMNILFKSYTKI